MSNAAFHPSVDSSHGCFFFPVWRTEAKPADTAASVRWRRRIPATHLRHIKIEPLCLHSLIEFLNNARVWALSVTQWVKWNLWTRSVRQLSKVRNGIAISIIDGVNQWVIVLGFTSVLPASLFFNSSLSKGFRFYPVLQPAPFYQQTRSLSLIWWLQSWFISWTDNKKHPIWASHRRMGVIFCLQMVGIWKLLLYRVNSAHTGLSNIIFKFLL